MIDMEPMAATSPTADLEAARAQFRSATALTVPVSSLWTEPTGRDPADAYIASGGMKNVSRHGSRHNYAVLEADSTGSADSYRLADGLTVVLINCVLAGARQRFLTDEPLLMLRASLTCDCSYQVESMEPMTFRRPEVAIAYVPAGRTLCVDIGESRQQGVLVFTRATEFAQRFGLEAEDLPPMLAAAVRGDAAAGRIAGFPIDHRIASLIADLLDSPLTGEAKAVQVMGRVIELVALSLSAMQAAPLLRNTTLVRRRDVDLAYAARECLERTFLAPPPFAELARRIGTNRNKLNVVFRETFGITMSDYCLERRLREAQRLLIEGRLSIGQIAELVGYEQQSSFAVAFRAATGMSPREYGKHRGSFSVPLETTP